VPANTASLKIMLYWNDPAILPISSRTLVNDLDAELITPGNTVILPQVLDTLPANVNNPATNKPDHINNIEQIVINQPAAGTYTVNVKGTDVAQGPQEYFLVYDIIPVSLNITYPMGAENMVPGEPTRIRWDAYGLNGNGFDLEYSIDNGNSWNPIAQNISITARYYDWPVANHVTTNARIRISQSGGGLSSTSQRFTMLAVPFVSLSPDQCYGSVAIQWNAVPGATDYEVMMLRGVEMQSMLITNNTAWVFNSLNPDSTYW
jgi:hypothetical protein